MILLLICLNMWVMLLKWIRNEKFAGVCLNNDITKPLPGSLVVSFGGKYMKIPLIYEGLHEVCPLCGVRNIKLSLVPCYLLSPKKRL